MRADRGPGRQEIHIFYRHTHTGTADGTAAPSMADEDVADGVRTAPTSPVMGAPAASAAPPGRLPRIVVMPSPPPGEVAAFGVSASAASAAGVAAAGDDAGLLAAQQRELADREEARHAAELFRLLPARCVGTGLHPPRPANVPAHVGPNHLPMSAHARWRRHQFPLRPAPAPAPACRVCASCLRRSPKAARRCGPRSRPMVDGWLMDSTPARPAPSPSSSSSRCCCCCYLPHPNHLTQLDRGPFIAWVATMPSVFSPLSASNPLEFVFLCLAGLVETHLLPSHSPPPSLQTRRLLPRF